MGLYGMMRTSVSGMNAQANRLSTVADNIANASTVGYKRASTEFSSLVLQSSGSSYESGSVQTRVRYGISEPGTLKFTTSVTDLAVKGQGFFLVNNENGQTFMTRAGSFVKDSSGDLVNAAGFKLMGYSLAPGAPTPVANGTAGLEVVNISPLALQAAPSTAGNLFVNLPANAQEETDLPSGNAGTAAYTAKTSLVTYDNLGNKVTLDVYMTKTGPEAWEVSVYNQADATNGGFPYGAAALVTENLTFDPTTGRLDAGSPTAIDIPVPNGATVRLDMSETSQLGSGYTLLDAGVNGNAPSEVERVEIDNDGTLYAVFENGARVATYRIPLADVASPDNLQPLAGNVFAPSVDSGDIRVGFAGEGSFGSMESQALEQSTVDMAAELTAMIESERNYTANSKVFQAGSDLMDVVVNLRR
ncbi:MAG: flagellar hook protein FlgE [Hyphomonadaceae bacterium]|jgi:flagellar hook protein FlgE|nr:flagellar hook protein FlgE [Hyphomonadaceae bacterium]